MLRSLLTSALILIVGVDCPLGEGAQAEQHSVSSSLAVPTSYPDEPNCRVKSIEKLPTAFEGGAKSPTTDTLAVSMPDTKGVYQAYLVKNGSKDFRCITCTQQPGGPLVDRNKMMITWHPSGQWLIVGIEEDAHDNMWMPKSWQLGLLQSGIWLNMWITTATGDRWYQMTDFKKNKSGKGSGDGFVGTPFTPDGRRAVWAEIVDGNILANHFGKWRLYMADFQVSPDGSPLFAHKKDITPDGARWVEPGNFSPDGRRILLSSDIGLSDAQGQDQWSLDITTGDLQQLTKTPKVWDEHGIYSPNGKKISFMSSYPYRNEPDSYKTAHLKTEFMMMNADGSHLQQLTHFNVPGYPESQPRQTIAAVAGFSDGDGSQMFSTVMGPKFSKTNWTITFEGACGGR